MSAMISVYNEQRSEFHALHAGVKDRNILKSLVDTFVTADLKKISWTREVKNDLRLNKRATYQELSERVAIYRPFVKQQMYYSRQFNNCIYQMPRIFPTGDHRNVIIAITGAGASKNFSVLAGNVMFDLEVISKSQCFPLYLYEKVETKAGELDLAQAGEEEGEMVDGYRRKSGVTDGILKEFRAAYGQGVTKEDVFYYVYGVLHSPEYRERFSADLKKMLPRIPMTQEKADYQKFTAAGRELAEWHLNYETVPPHPDTALSSDVLGLDKWELCKVQKMTHPKVNKQVDRSTIIVNPHLRVTGIPLEAYDYIVNGKAALDWIMERYQVTVDKESGIRNDPNDWCREQNNPSYIPDLIRRVAHVSTETMRIVKGLPALNERIAINQEK